MSPRSRRHERLHALGADPVGGPRPLHESPAAQRLRARIPRPPLVDSPVPAAPYAVDETDTEYRSELPRDVVSPALRRSSVPSPRHHVAPRNQIASGQEHTPLTALLEESDTERLPPPSRSTARPSSATAYLAARTGSGARAGSDAWPEAAPGRRIPQGGPRARTSTPPHPSGRPTHVEPLPPSSAGTVDGLSTSSITDPGDDLLDATVTTRLRPRRAPSLHTPGPTGPTRDTEPPEPTRDTRPAGSAGHTVTGEPPISAEVLRNHRGLIPMGPNSDVDEDLPGPGDTVRLRPRPVGPALSSLEGGALSPGPHSRNGGPAFRGTGRPISSTTPHGPATRKWVGHRSLREQPREYRRPSWPADRPSGERRGTASAGWPDRDPEDTVTVPDPAPETGPEGNSSGPQDSPWLDPDDEEVLKERRPPSGYVEFDTEDTAESPMNRLARWWAPNATLSKRAVIALFVLGAAAVVAALLFLRREPEEVDVPEMVSQATPENEDGGGETSGDGTEPAPDEDVVVHVGGDVEDPGLYTLPPGARVLDAVEEAGGALPDADLDLVNLARPVVDGERILLGAEVAAEGAEGEGGEDGQRVSLNQADGSALETLPGIGEAKADAILEHRDSLGGSFSSVEDLMDVSGIGQSTFDNLEDHVTL